MQKQVVIINDTNAQRGATYRKLFIVRMLCYWFLTTLTSTSTEHRVFSRINPMWKNKVSPWKQDKTDVSTCYIDFSVRFRDMDLNWRTTPENTSCGDKLP